MNKKIIIILTLLLLIIVAIVSQCSIKRKIKNLDFVQNVKTATENTKIIDANIHHNQALDVIDYARKNNVKIPSILINFDTHSDIFLNTDLYVKKQDEVHLGNWINELLAKNPEINEIYWVLPDEEAKDLVMRFLFAKNQIKDFKDSYPPLYGNSTNEMNPFYFIQNPIYKKVYIQEILLNPKTGKINEKPKNEKILSDLFDETEKNLRTIKIISCTKDTLPDFKGKNIFLSIDADYTSNSGFDTTNSFKFIKSPHEIIITINSIFETLNKKNIKPQIISLSLSPEYLPKRSHYVVTKIFQHVTNLSGLPDNITDYERNNEYNLDPKLKNLLNIIYF